MDPMTTDDALAHIEATIRRWLVGSPSRGDAQRMAATLGTEAAALSRVVDAFPQAGQASGSGHGPEDLGRRASSMKFAA